jgi:hypothetical protein
MSPHIALVRVVPLCYTVKIRILLVGHALGNEINPFSSARVKKRSDGVSACLAFVEFVLGSRIIVVPHPVECARSVLTHGGHRYESRPCPKSWCSRCLHERPLKMRDPCDPAGRELFPCDLPPGRRLANSRISSSSPDMGIVFRKILANSLLLFLRASSRVGLRLVTVQDEIKSLAINLLLFEGIGRGTRRLRRVHECLRV